MNNERIIFLGTPKIAADFLKDFINCGFNVVGVITKEDKVRGRNNKVEESDVAKIAHEFNIPLHKPHKLNNDYKFIEDLNPDLLLTFAYGQILSEKVLSLGKYKPLNLHGSLLPKYRGASPIQCAIRNGDKITGISLMEMVKEMDKGDIYSEVEVDIDENDNYTTLNDKLSQAALTLVKQALPLYFANKLFGIKQDDNLASYCTMIKKEDEHLNLELTCYDFINQIRSLSFTPGGYLLLNDENIKIYEAKKFSDNVNCEVGKIVLAKKKNIILQLKDGQINLLTLQRPGKKIMSAVDFNNGYKNLEGQILK